MSAKTINNIVEMLEAFGVEDAVEFGLFLLLEDFEADA